MKRAGRWLSWNQNIFWSWLCNFPTVQPLASHIITLGFQGLSLVIAQAWYEYQMRQKMRKGFLNCKGGGQMQGVNINHRTSLLPWGWWLGKVGWKSVVLRRTLEGFTFRCKTTAAVQADGQGKACSLQLQLRFQFPPFTPHSLTCLWIGKYQALLLPHPQEGRKPALSHREVESLTITTTYWVLTMCQAWRWVFYIHDLTYFYQKMTYD